MRHVTYGAVFNKKRDLSLRLVFFISFMLSNVRSVLSQCNTCLRLLHLLYDVEVMRRKAIRHTSSRFYALIKHGCLTNQSSHRILSIL